MKYLNFYEVEDALDVAAHHVLGARLPIVGHPLFKGVNADVASSCCHAHAPSGERDDYSSCGRAGDALSPPRC